MAVFVYILLGIFCLQQSILTSTSSSRIDQRLTTAELRLDVIENEITNFQQGIMDKLQDHEIHIKNVSEINVDRINARITATEKMAAEIDKQVESTHLSLAEKISDLKIQLSDYKTQLKDYKIKYQNMQTQINEIKSCPLQWYQHGRSCYYLSYVTKSWFKAADWCRWHNGHLVEYNDMNEVYFVKNMANTLGTWSNHKWESFWVGGDDIDEEGTFRWSESHTQLTYRNKPLTSAGLNYWVPGEPTGYDGEDCMASTIYRNGMWNNEPCTNSHLFVCEKRSL